MQASVLLFRWGSYCWACNLLVLIIYLFFLPVMLPSVLPRLATDSAGRVFPGVWKPLFLRVLSRDGIPFLGQSSLPTSFVSFFVFYIFSYLFLKTMICFSGCLMCLQKLFCEVCSALKCSFEEFVGEKVVFPSYSSAIFPSLSQIVSKCSTCYSDLFLLKYICRSKLHPIWMTCFSPCSEAQWSSALP